ncbi:restriction endonuclease subunit S [Streptomyces sp. DH12]|uniref:restriction endonuclease subunit S n=1 Tax=Streptomyces sp. DH12 TaxID=2857010 RepID=UPI001E2EC9B9|nr:restriction endonuclease subunit S [Streptomyces sp. DH12]
MSLNLDKTAWKRVRLGDVIRRSRTQADPVNGDVDRYVGGGHIDSDSLTIERFGDVNDGQMGSTFTYLFEPGQILFVSARPYLRKSGVVNFSGVVADKTYVLDAIPENGLLQDFLPFVLASAHFIAYATAEATGSMNPRLLWGQMQRYEFDLPPLDEQQRLADLLWALESHRQALASMAESLEGAVTAKRESELASASWELTLGDALLAITAGKSLSGKSTPAAATTCGVLRVSAVSERGFMALENKELVEQSAFMPEYALRNGDLLITRANTAAYVGRPAIVDADYPNLMLSDKTLRLDVDEAVASTSFVYECLLSQRIRQRVADTATGTGAAMKNISQKEMRAFPLPKMAKEAQKKLVVQIGWIRSAAKASRQEGEAALTLRGQLLATIFGGAE